jgi:hypothetical protein
LLRSSKAVHISAWQDCCTGEGEKRTCPEEERSRIITLVAKDPPGRLVRYDGLPLEARDESKAAHWTLDTLTEAAQSNAVSG